MGSRPSVGHCYPCVSAMASTTGSNSDSTGIDVMASSSTVIVIVLVSVSLLATGKFHGFKIIHRSLEICLELNLLNGVKFHEKLVSRIVPVDMDLASSWVDMAIFKEKQHQVLLLPQSLVSSRS